MRKALVLAMVLATPAHAATVSIEGTRIVYTAKAGEKNVVTANFGTDDIRLGDKGTNVTAGSGCEQLDTQTASCPAAALTVALGDGDDVARVECLEQRGLCGGVTLRGGSGDDSLTGDDRVDVIEGGPGDDQLYGEGGPDVMRGGAGNDFINAAPNLYGGDVLPRIFCGRGRDHVFAEAQLTLDCEDFTAAFFVFRGRLHVRGDMLSIAIRHADCPFEFRWGDGGRIHRSTFHPRAWSRATLRLPHKTGPSPHLNYRQTCAADQPFVLLFRFKNPFWERPS